MRLVGLLLCACALVAGCNEHAPTRAGIPDATPDDVRGLWQWLDGPRSCTAIESDTSGAVYVGITMHDPDCPCCPGERRWEFQWDSARRSFSGRHLWGGCGYDTLFWGEGGGLELWQHGLDTLQVVYHDSVYEGGWKLVRVSACGEASSRVPTALPSGEPPGPGDIGNPSSRRLVVR
jgi:hypothetical protein